VTTSAELYKLGVDAAHEGRQRDALDLFLQVVELDPRNELAWMWLTGYLDDVDDKIVACQNVLTLNPANEKVRIYLDLLLRQKEMPGHDKELDPQSAMYVQIPTHAPVSLSLAEQLEDEGQFEEAIKTYEQLAAKTKDSATFDHIYKQIDRLEGLQKEKIQYVAPAANLLRLSFTWTLVYLSFMLVQVGLRPFSNLSVLWLGLPFVALGSFLLALSEIRIKHFIWQAVFLEEGNGSGFARVVLAAIGWVFIILPFGFMVLNSLLRLKNFQIPPEPL
jgi:tetratricopeptide (TPR) repeat protein